MKKPRITKAESAVRLLLTLAAAFLIFGGSADAADGLSWGEEYFKWGDEATWLEFPSWLPRDEAFLVGSSANALSYLPNGSTQVPLMQYTMDLGRALGVPVLALHGRASWHEMSSFVDFLGPNAPSAAPFFASCNKARSNDFFGFTSAQLYSYFAGTGSYGVHPAWEGAAMWPAYVDGKPAPVTTLPTINGDAVLSPSCAYAYFAPDGKIHSINIREQPWYDARKAALPPESGSFTCTVLGSEWTFPVFNPGPPPWKIPMLDNTWWTGELMLSKGSVNPLPPSLGKLPLHLNPKLPLGAPSAPLRLHPGLPPFARPGAGPGASFRPALGPPVRPPLKPPNPGTFLKRLP